MAGIELLFVFLSLSYIPEIDFLTCHMQFRTPAHWCVSEHNSVRSEPLLFDSTWLRPDENIQVLLVQVRILFFYHIISLTSVQIYRCSFTISRSRGTSGSLFAPSIVLISCIHNQRSFMDQILRMSFRSDWNIRICDLLPGSVPVHCRDPEHLFRHHADL